MRNTENSFAMYASMNLDSVANYQSPSKHYVTKDPNERKAGKAVVVARGKRVKEVTVLVEESPVEYVMNMVTRVMTIDGVKGEYTVAEVVGSNGVKKLFIGSEQANAWIASQK